MHTDNVSFKAIPVSKSSIPMKYANKWVKEEVQFIRLNPRLKNDMATLKNIEKLWQNKNLSGSIREQAQITKDPVYALCVKNVDVKNVDPLGVLGVFITDKINKATNAVEIYRLGVNPEFAYAQKNRHRDIKHIGSTMIKEFLKFIDKKTNVKTVSIASEPENVKFYQRINFLRRENSIHVFEVNKEHFKDIVK